MDMERYIAFLRGVNISGKNKVPMAELKMGFERLGYREVKTYQNSGNVIFSSDENDIERITKEIAMMIKNQFVLDIPVFVIAKKNLKTSYAMFPTGGAMKIRKFTIILFSLCRLLHLPMYSMKSENRKKA